MNLRRILTLMSCAAALACLSVGTSNDWRWLALGLCGLILLAGLMKPIRELEWMPSILLVGYLLAAVSALLAGGSPLWLVPGSASALFVWDLIQFSRSMEGKPETSLERGCEQEHLKALGIVALFSAALIAVGLGLQIQASFALMLVALTGGFLGLLLVWRLQKKKTP